MKTKPPQVALTSAILFLAVPALAAAPATGPLRVCPENPRYFTDGTKGPDGSSRAIYLTGSHVWGNFQDYGYATGYRNPPPVFDYPAYLDLLQRHHHNFIRLWAFEGPHASGGQKSDEAHYVAPLPYQRTGPGMAADGGLKFDLTRFNQDYFNRLRSRVMAARDRNIYVSVMLFQGWSVFKFSKTYEAWLYHPLHRENNLNGMDGDPNRSGEGEEVHGLQVPEITRLQEAYVRKVVDMVNDLDNVLYEISNESQPSVATRDWEYHMVRFVKAYEKTKLQQHPVGVTSNARHPTDVLDTSPSDWVSLRRKDSRDWLYVENSPAADGRKVSILDTDHLGAPSFIADAGYSRRWVWKAFARGHNPILQDAYGTEDTLWDPRGAGLVAARQALGHTRRYAEKMNLPAITPRSELASTGYCLATPGMEYLIYQPKGGDGFSVELSAGLYRYEWFNPANGEVAGSGDVQVPGGGQPFTAPFAGDSVLYLRKG